MSLGKAMKSAKVDRNDWDLDNYPVDSYCDLDCGNTAAQLEGSTLDDILVVEEAADSSSVRQVPEMQSRHVEVGMLRLWKILSKGLRPSIEGGPKPSLRPRRNRVPMNAVVELW
jgi:hypothetical protein